MAQFSLLTCMIAPVERVVRSTSEGEREGERRLCERAISPTRTHKQTHIHIFYIRSCSTSTYIAHAPVRVSRLQQQPCDRVLRLALSYSVLRFSNDQARALDIPLLYTHIRPLPPTHVSTRLRMQSSQQAESAYSMRVRAESCICTVQNRIRTNEKRHITRLPRRIIDICGE